VFVVVPPVYCIIPISQIPTSPPPCKICRFSFGTCGGLPLIGSLMEIGNGEESGEEDSAVSNNLEI